MEFNIFYLNFSKVYETRMLIDNKVIDEITHVKSYSNNNRDSIGFNSKKFNLIHEENNGEYFKLTETIKVKQTKSVILKNLLNYCKVPNEIGDIQEGDLIRLDNIKIEFLDDEETQRILSFLSKEALKGISYEGMDINNFISKSIYDEAFKMKFKYYDEAFVFKIPMENSSEFESKYSINDLLIGELSLVGIYKGKISKNELKNSSFLNSLNQKSDDSSIIESSYNKLNKFDEEDSYEDFHYVDIFAIIQEIKFNIIVDEHKNSKFKNFINKIKSFFKGELK